MLQDGLQLRYNGNNAPREQNKMSQTELAQLVGVRRETIGHLENGHYNPSLVLAAKIAKVFNVTIEDMFIIIDE